MPECFDICSASGGYPVKVGIGSRKTVMDAYKGSIFIVDSKLTDIYVGHDKTLIEIEAIEDNKSLEQMPKFIDMLRQVGANRQSHVIAIGGGIIQDISAFLTSIYMRGIPWTYLPTTVLSMADSCIGGKSSINVQNHKNLVGNFYPPQDIIVDPEFLITLNKEMVIGGLFEASKICYASGSDKFKEYLSLTPEIATEPDEAEPIINLALRTKKWFIEIDEFDRKERLLLNFGHTFGHAVEAATHFGVSHGIGVGIGMAIACSFSRQNGPLTSTGNQLVDLLEQHIRCMLEILDADPDFIKSPIDINSVLDKFEFDKKHQSDAYRLVVPNSEGILEITKIPRNSSSRKLIERIYCETLSSLKWAVT